MHRPAFAAHLKDTTLSGSKKGSSYWRALDLRQQRLAANHLVAYCLLSVLLNGCSPPSSPTAPPVPLLNSERIEQQFGSYDLSLLSQSDSLRVSNLFSTRDGVSTTRTLALVQFSSWATDPAIDSIHQQILAGASIGATFKKAGWKVSKHGHHFGSYDVVGNTSDATLIRDLMRLELPAQLAFHVYELQVDNGQRTVSYAQLVELHHPEYLRLADLESIYPKPVTASGSSGHDDEDIKTTLSGLLESAAAE